MTQRLATLALIVILLLGIGLRKNKPQHISGTDSRLSSCVVSPAVAPIETRLDWPNIRSLDALDLCVAEVATLIADGDGVKAWMLKNGMKVFGPIKYDAAVRFRFKA